MQAAVRSIVRASMAAAKEFSPWSRSVITLAVLAFLVGATYVHRALATGPLIDERTWVDRSLAPLWGPPYGDNIYYYAVHHPSFARMVYGGVLHAMGIYEFEAPLVDYSKSAEWNFDHGAMVPLGIETPLRLVNVAFLSGMIALVYFGLKRILANRALAAAGCLPLIFNSAILGGPCPYIGTDAMLLFWLAVFWFTWITLGARGTWGVAALSVVAGFLVSTKLNGAFPVAGACAYYAATGKGTQRIIRPLLLAAVPLAMFVAMNPIYRAQDLGWAVKVGKDVVRIMLELKAKSTSKEWAEFTRAEVLRESFPYWYFFIPWAAVAATARREKWFAPTIVWASTVVFLNWALIYIPLLRYSAPISMGFLVAFSATGLTLVARTFRESALGREIAGGGR